MKSSVFYTCFLGFLCIIGWAVGLGIFLQHIPYKGADTTTKTDAIVVLTGGKGRVLAGISLLEQNRADQLLISGVGENANIRELKVLSDEVVPEQVLPLEHRITLGHFAKNTKENAMETALWMGQRRYKSLRLVTSSYHMPRSILEFKRYMPNVTIIQHPVFPSNFKLSRWWLFPGTARLILSEYHKYMAVWVWYKLEGFRFSLTHHLSSDSSCSPTFE